MMRDQDDPIQRAIARLENKESFRSKIRAKGSALRTGAATTNPGQAKLQLIH